MTAKRALRFVPLWVFAITVVALAIHPIPECFDCEGPNPWGRDDLVYATSVKLLDAWLIGGSAVAGFLSIRRNWLVPMAITFADLLTQPIGGVPLWSLTRNEGPLIVIAGMMVGTVSLFIGWGVRFALNRLGPKILARNAQGTIAK
jgi:hypothetical protein